MFALVLNEESKFADSTLTHVLFPFTYVSKSAELAFTQLFQLITNLFVIPNDAGQTFVMSSSLLKSVVFM